VIWPGFEHTFGIGSIDCCRSGCADSHAGAPDRGGPRRALSMVRMAAKTRLDHIKFHYYASHESVNPTGIVPAGPELDPSAPHGRDGVGAGQAVCS
jgi:hypothetical protein